MTGRRQLTIGDEFAGFPRIAHGGYVCGLLAAALPAPRVRTRFVKPVPTRARLVRVTGWGAPLSPRRWGRAAA